MQVSTHTISGIELFDVKRINRATIADGELLNNYVYEPLIQNEDILASAVGSAYNAIDYINHTLQDKKDKQDVISLSGSATKTVKKITQNENGEMTVEFQDIDLPPEVPNVELISTDESISISATSVGNDVTYDLSVKDIASDANYALLSVSGYSLTANHFGGVVFDNYTTKGITWSTVDNRLEIPSSIKLLDVNVECELLLSNINNVSYGNLVLYIYQDWGLLEEKTFEIDLSKERHLVNFTTKMLDVENLQFTIKSPANGTANIRVGVNDESSVMGNGGGSTYYAELNINLCCENFVEWNFNRQSTDDMLANPLLALCDTSGTPSGTLNAGDKYMLYLDGLLGQSASNNTYVNFGIQSGTVGGQYLLSGNGAPLPSKKLCRSTSTGNDFACSFMFTVPTNGSYAVAVQPTQNSQEYKFFGNTTIRQIKIG